MGMISLRLGVKEEKALHFLQDHSSVDRSTIIKEAILEKYEDLQDLEFIEKFEQREKKGKIRFFSAQQILGKLK
jgi:predicted DNA-binding protein